MKPITLGLAERVLTNNLIGQPATAKLNDARQAKAVRAGLALRAAEKEKVLEVNCDGNFWVLGNCSVGSFTDRTPLAASLEEARSIMVGHVALPGKAREMDHTKLPAIARTAFSHKDTDGKDVIDDGRNLSLTVSAAAQLIADLLDRVDKLEAALAIKGTGRITD